MKIRMMEAIKNRLKAFGNRLEWSLDAVTILNWIVFLVGIPCVLYLPREWGFENGPLENMQMIALLISFILCFMVKHNKKLFRFFALIITILALREVNCGRTIFFPIEGEVNKFHSWKDIKYGYLAHPIFGAYIALTGVYFLWNKLYLNFWHYLKNAKIAAWNLIFLGIGITGALIGEEYSMMVLEEVTELLTYTAAMGFVYQYGFSERYALEEIA